MRPRGGPAGAAGFLGPAPLPLPLPPPWVAEADSRAVWLHRRDPPSRPGTAHTTRWDGPFHRRDLRLGGCPPGGVGPAHKSPRGPGLGPGSVWGGGLMAAAEGPVTPPRPSRDMPPWAALAAEGRGQRGPFLAAGGDGQTEPAPRPAPCLAWVRAPRSSSRCFLQVLGLERGTRPGLSEGLPGPF